MSAPTKKLPYGFIPPPFPRPNVELVETDNENMDSDWHRRAMNLLIELIDSHFCDRTDYYCGGDMFIYFSEQQARNRDFKGPDFFFVWDRPRTPLRPWWAIWEEDYRFPNVIIELLSPKTRANDLGHKKDVYEGIFKTPEYFCYDPETQELSGWRLIGGSYQMIEPNARQHLWSDQLSLFVGRWIGKVFPYDAVWLRFFTADGKLVRTLSETLGNEAEIAKQEAELARRQLEFLERKRQFQAGEIARLKAQLAAKDAPETPTNP